MTATLHSATIKWLVLLICGVGLSQGIASEQQKVEGDNIVGAIDPAAERRLGELALQQVVDTYALSTDKAKIALVNEIGFRILRAIDDTAFPDDWQFVVINLDRVNAFSLPGGKIIICSRLLRDITADGKTDTGILAAVIGHEIAHVRMHHAMANLRNTAS